MNQTNNRIREENWRDEFRKQFIWDDENELGIPTNPFPSSNSVISFIDELLKSQREELVEKIEKHQNFITMSDYDVGYNDCKENIINLIKEE